MQLTELYKNKSDYRNSSEMVVNNYIFLNFRAHFKWFSRVLQMMFLCISNDFPAYFLNFPRMSLFCRVLLVPVSCEGLQGGEVGIRWTQYSNCSYSPVTRGGSFIRQADCLGAITIQSFDLHIGGCHTESRPLFIHCMVSNKV